MGGRRGLMVHVYRAADEYCTNRGVTSKFDVFVLTGEGIPEIFEPSERMPELRLERRRLFGDEDHLRVIPVERPDGDRGAIGPMFGGNFVWSCDSRFREISEGPLPVHDRFETVEMYDALTR